MYMLLLIDKEENGKVDGTHLQWCSGCSIEEAEKSARATEKANGNRISVAVIDEVYDSYAMGRQYKEKKRLDNSEEV